MSEASTRVCLGTVDEFPLGEGVSVQPEELPMPLAVFRLEDGIYALPDHCPHKGAPLSRAGTTPKTDNPGGTRGQLDPEELTVSCPWHGMIFDLESGDAPATSYRVRPFDVVVEDGEVILER
jgi:nitrite reductase/ring-hydroxylating ferredoxin subunit